MAWVSEGCDGYLFECVADALHCWIFAVIPLVRFYPGSEFLIYIIFPWHARDKSARPVGDDCRDPRKYDMCPLFLYRQDGSQCMKVFHQGMELLAWNSEDPGGVGEVPGGAADLFFQQRYPRMVTYQPGYGVLITRKLTGGCFILVRP